MKKLIRTADVREAMDRYHRGEVSYQKAVDMLDERARDEALKVPELEWEEKL